MGAGNQTPGPLQEQYAFLTAEPSLQPCGAYVLLMVTVNKDKILVVRAGKKSKAVIGNRWKTSVGALEGHPSRKEALLRKS